MVVLVRGKGAENIQYTMTNNGQPMALRSAKPNRYTHYATPGQGWQFFLGTLAVGENRLRYTLPPGSEKMAVQASLSAEAPLAKHRLELNFSGGGEPGKEKTSLPLLYGDRQRQVVEVDLRKGKLAPASCGKPFAIATKSTQRENRI